MLTWFATDLQPGDGTRYTLHVVKHQYGGYLVCCNDDSMWLAFKDGEVKCLAGNDNGFTALAISDYMLGLDLK